MSRRDTALFALFALFAGALVYLGARPDSAYAMGGSAAAFANLPSFLHTVAFAIAIALCFEMRTARWLAALAWGSVEVIAELLQLLPSPPVQFAGFRLQWTFDRLDVVACVCGLLVALLVLNKLERE